MKKCLFSFYYILFFCLPLTLFAQEMDFQIMIDKEQVQTTEKQIFEDMKKNITNFLNKQKWTEDEYRTNERIQCNLTITLREMDISNGYFRARTQVQAVRPVHGVGYESMTISYVDKNFEFNYNSGQQMNFNENAFRDNLTSMLAFYVYVLLGIDYDTFSELGGSDHIETAQKIANIAQNASQRKGWGEFEDNPNNRFNLIQNLNNPQFKPFRKSLYLYHRKGMDLLAREPEKARKNILEALKLIKKSYDVEPNSPLLRSFFSAKSRELVNIYSKGEAAIRQEAFDLLKNLDPTNSDKYKVIEE